MGKRKKSFQRRLVEKKPRIPMLEHEEEREQHDENFQVQSTDLVEKKVDLIMKDAETNSYRSLTIWGTGLSVEKTIKVVEQLKQLFTKQGTEFNQETAIKTGDDNQPHLQIILTRYRDCDNSVAPCAL